MGEAIGEPAAAVADSLPAAGEAVAQPAAIVDDSLRFLATQDPCRTQDLFMAQASQVAVSPCQRLEFCSDEDRLTPHRFSCC